MFGVHLIIDKEKYLDSFLEDSTWQSITVSHFNHSYSVSIITAYWIQNTLLICCEISILLIACSDRIHNFLIWII